VDVAEKLSAQLGIEVDRRRVELGDPIKRAGVYSVVVNLGHGLEPRINVVVEGEGGPAVAPAEDADETPAVEEEAA
jgi:large subunit ribosomal protein L9